MSKFSITEIFVDQARTLIDARTDRPLVRDYLTLVGLPLGAAAAAVFLGWQLQGTAEILGGLAIFTGLLFGLVVWVFQLRIQVASDPRTSGVTNLIRLIDELFTNVLYALVAGAGTTTVAMIASAVTMRDAPVAVGWTAAVVGLTVHFLLVLAMCVKRVKAAYRQLTR